MTRFTSTLTLAACLTVAFVNTASVNNGGRATIRVKPTQAIQSALNTAPARAKVIVDAGTYYDNWSSRLTVSSK